MAERDGAANVQLKFRVKERLRAALEEAARQRGVSLSAEIAERLEKSFFKPGSVVDTKKVALKIFWAMTELHALQGEVLDLAKKLQKSEHKDLVIKIARALTSIEATNFAAATEIIPIPDQETSQ